MRYVNDKSSVKYWQVTPWCHMVSVVGNTKAPAHALIPLSPLRQQRQRRREAASSSCPTRPTSFFRCPSPISLIPVFSPSVLRLPKLCYVSSCTSPMLSSLHVNKCTHPQYIIEAGLYVHVMAVRCAEPCWWSCHANSASSVWHWHPSTLPQLLSITSPTLCPCGTEHGQSPLSPHFSGCCLVILPWKSLNHLLPWGETVWCSNLCFRNKRWKWAEAVFFFIPFSNNNNILNL